MSRDPNRPVSRQALRARELVEQGLCVYGASHGPPVPGLQACEACRAERAAEAAARYRALSPEGRQRVADTLRARRERYKALGFCLLGKNHDRPRKGKLLCDACETICRRRSKEHHARKARPVDRPAPR